MSPLYSSETLSCLRYVRSCPSTATKSASPSLFRKDSDTTRRGLFKGKLNLDEVETLAAQVAVKAAKHPNKVGTAEAWIATLWEQRLKEAIGKEAKRSRRCKTETDTRKTLEDLHAESGLAKRCQQEPHDPDEDSPRWWPWELLSDPDAISEEEKRFLRLIHEKNLTRAEAARAVGWSDNDAAASVRHSRVIVKLRWLLDPEGEVTATRSDPAFAKLKRSLRKDYE